MIGVVQKNNRFVAMIYIDNVVVVLMIKILGDKLACQAHLTLQDASASPSHVVLCVTA